MARKLSLGQIVENASKIADVNERVAYLQQHQSQPLKELLRLGLSRNVEWDLPEGAPPYKVQQFLDQEGMLYHEARRLYLFIKGERSDLTKLKKEMLYIGLLESIHPQDAQLLIDIKDKKLPKTISKKIVDAVFPGLVDS